MQQLDADEQSPVRASLNRLPASVVTIEHQRIVRLMQKTGRFNLIEFICYDAQPVGHI